MKKIKTFLIFFLLFLGGVQLLASCPNALINMQFEVNENTKTSSITKTFPKINNITAKTNLSDLIIGIYLEGTSYNKALGIYNGTGAPVNLGNYSLKIAFNGGGTFGAELVLSGTIANDAFYVIVNDDAGASLLAKADLVYAGTCLNFNGNDAIALYNNSSKAGIIDKLGDENNSAIWGEGATFVRKKDNISGPSTTYNSSNWEDYGEDEFDVFDNAIILPIELLSFNAFSNNQKVELNWSTASEINNSYFTVERSVDAENFEIIKTVSGAGNSNSQINYSATDNNPLSELSYYRLKQTDFNGDYSYSKIVAFENSSEIMSLKILNLYSKPNSINFTISNPNLENLSYEIINTLGKVLISSKVENVVKKSNIVVSDNDLSHGIYFIKLSSSKETVVEKVLF